MHLIRKKKIANKILESSICSCLVASQVASCGFKLQAGTSEFFGIHVRNYILKFSTSTTMKENILRKPGQTCKAIQ